MSWLDQQLHGLREDLQTTPTCDTGQQNLSISTPSHQGICISEQNETTGIDAILAQREARYGGFRNNAIIAQSLKSVLQTHPSWGSLDPFHQEALHQILSKVSRLVFNPNYLDNWTDIAGYATLVIKELNENTHD
jgi:hypothetical protein